MKFKAVLFDLDGTLLDTIEDIARSMNAVLARSGFPEHEIDQYKNFVGDGIGQLVCRSLPQANRDDQTVATAIHDYRREYNRRWAEHSRPYEDIPEMLAKLTKQGLKMAILSNKSHDFTLEMVAHLLGGFQFETVQGAIPGQPIKPDPAGALKIANRLALTPAEFIYLGDMAVDMKTARASGMVPVGALWGFRPEKELAEAGAEILISQPLELLNLI